MTSLGLYVHVPFCRSKCDWCAFASEVGAGRSEAWLERILHQLETPPSHDSRWATVYLGGGTPSLLSPEQLDRLLAKIGERRLPEAELTLEANPESLTAEHLAVLWQGGGTRLSLGIQTFQEALLKRHGRPTRHRHLDHARKLAEAWPGQLSLDLICGLSGQTAQGQRRDLERALDWEPDHLSFYSLTVEPGTPLAAREARHPSVLPGDKGDSWWLEGRDFLEAHGYAAYEVSNFARPGAESRHNQRYWALEPWWGVGPSAVSFLPSDRGWSYWTQTSALTPWLEGTPPDREIPTALELAKDRLLAGLRRRTGVASAPWKPLLPETLKAWEGRILEQDGRLFLSRETFPFLDAFLRQAFGELDGRPEFR